MGTTASHAIACGICSPTSPRSTGALFNSRNKIFGATWEGKKGVNLGQKYTGDEMLQGVEKK